MHVIETEGFLSLYTGIKVSLQSNRLMRVPKMAIGQQQQIKNEMWI